MEQSPLDYTTIQLEFKISNCEIDPNDLNAIPKIFNWAAENDSEHGITLFFEKVNHKQKNRNVNHKFLWQSCVNLCFTFSIFFIPRSLLPKRKCTLNFHRGRCVSMRYCFNDLTCICAWVFPAAQLKSGKNIKTGIFDPGWPDMGVKKLTRKSVLTPKWGHLGTYPLT